MPSMVAALKNAEATEATLVQEGYTHQYSNVANPYNGVSGDDSEFYPGPVRDHADPPVHLRRPCQNTDSVIWRGRCPATRSAGRWAASSAGQALFTAAGLPTPTIWMTPHYFAVGRRLRRRSTSVSRPVTSGRSSSAAS